LRLDAPLPYRGGANRARNALLLLRCGLRYEGWMIAIPYTGLLLYRVARGAVTGRARGATLLAALLPWVIPGIWVAGQWL
jgi:hypothetical protein